MAYLLTKQSKYLGLAVVVLVCLFCVVIVTRLFTDLEFFQFVLLILVSIGFCGGFISFLLHMLPKKRPVEVDGDSGSDNSSDNLRKKARIGCLTSSCSSITSRTITGGTGDCDGKKISGGEESNNSASSTVVEPSLTNMGFEDATMQDIDEDLHSRQLAVYGRETMRRLFASNVLISGM